MKFRGVATKYLQNYLMWFVVMNKYLKNKVESDIGRLLNLSSHDRWAWERYFKLIKLKYLNIDLKDATKYLEPNSFDAVISNPPYKLNNSRYN